MRQLSMKKVSILAMFALTGYVLLAASSSSMLAPWWEIAGACAVVAVVSGVFVYRKWSVVTSSNNRFVNFSAHVVAGTGLALLLSMGINFIPAPWAQAHTETVAVVRTYKSEHNKTRRVRRNTYAPTGEKYYRYHAVVRMSGGTIKTLDIPRSRYNALRNADSMSVIVRSGFVGIPMVRAEWQNARRD